MKLDAALASKMARIALGHVGQEYPHKLDHVLESDADALPPRVLHSIFYGSFDWHSCVHGWWTLLTLRRLFPHVAEAVEIAQRAAECFSPEKAAVELAYMERPSSRGFERPYGWAWLLALHLEASRHSEPWAIALEPLARAFAGWLGSYLEVMTYPIRVGTHFNTSFAMILSLDWAEVFDAQLAQQIRDRSRAWFSEDRDCQAWEPGGDEFLSSALCEALCMAKCDPVSFSGWFASFLPRTAQGQPVTLFTPATVSDRSDGKIAHLDGLNLSRAWCWRTIAPLLPDAEREAALAGAQAHIASAMPHISGDYAGEHWLATFALLALLSPGSD